MEDNSKIQQIPNPNNNIYQNPFLFINPFGLINQNNNNMNYPFVNPFLISPNLIAQSLYGTNDNNKLENQGKSKKKKSYKRKEMENDHDLDNINNIIDGKKKNHFK